MHASPHSPDLSHVTQSERKMQRETYERAGLEAHARGELRSRNPFVRAPDAAFLDAKDRDRMRLLAEHWWDGWDSWGKNAHALRRR